MKHLALFVATLLGLFIVETSYGQVTVVSSDMFRNPESTVTLKLIDSQTKEPMSFASVYLKAKGDTLITNFTLSDPEGKTELTKVTRGTYILSAEMLGYKTFNKEYYISKYKEELGTIEMVEDPEMIDAARVTAVGNPIEVKQDTIIYNASSFIVGENSMLEDLLKKMPGIEVSKDGKVTVNGESVSKITVGGKTFFFDDVNMALKNLPAKIVNKIRVIDKKAEVADFTGIAAEKEKVMDVEVKKEFQKGWFGNVKVGAGSKLASNSTDELVENRGLLYQGNAMLSGYNEKDLITLIANTYNAVVTDRDAMYVFTINIDGEDHPTDGLPIYRQVGANVNTSRIKNMESTAMVNYKNSQVDAKRETQRTTFITGGEDILSNTKTTDLYGEDALNATIQIKNMNRNKYYFSIEPTFRYNTVNRERSNKSITANTLEELNNSESNSYLESKYFLQRTDFDLGIRKLGNDRRNITFSGCYFYSDKNEDSKEYSQTWFGIGGTPTVKDMFYTSNNINYGYRASINYVEPIAKQWVISTKLYSFYSVKDNDKIAYDRTEESSGFAATIADKRNFTHKNDYYSSVMNNKYFYVYENVQLQYSKEQTSLQIGAQLQETYNETYSKYLGVEKTIGKDEWLLDWNPYINYRWYKDQKRFSAIYSGSSTQQRQALMMPMLDISVPTRISTGNIYLKPSFNNRASVNYSSSNKETQSSWNASMSASSELRSTVTASWYDNNGIMYSVPVNSQKPSYSLDAYSYESIPITKNKKLVVNIFSSITFRRSVSYQSVNNIQGLDTDNFNYNDFMNWFWGDTNGNLFYSERSGFKESVTDFFNASLSLRFSYRFENFYLGAAGSCSYNRSHYSLESRSDLDTWGNRVGIDMTWQTQHKFELSTDATYLFYYGYPTGYGEPYLDWNFSLTKNIKAFAIGIQVKDILNQQKTLSHIATSNYVEDSHRNILGRLFVISFKYNFGKLNASKNQKAQNAAWNMM